MRNYQKHVAAEGGSFKLAIRNIVCHLDMMSDEQKAAINWHAEQSASLAVMRLIDIDEYRAVGQTINEADPLSLVLNSVHVLLEDARQADAESDHEQRENWRFGHIDRISRWFKAQSPSARGGASADPTCPEGKPE